MSLCAQLLCRGRHQAPGCSSRTAHSWGSASSRQQARTCKAAPKDQRPYQVLHSNIIPLQEALADPQALQAPQQRTLEIMLPFEIFCRKFCTIPDLYKIDTVGCSLELWAAPVSLSDTTCTCHRSHPATLTEQEACHLNIRLNFHSCIGAQRWGAHVAW